MKRLIMLFTVILLLTSCSASNDDKVDFIFMSKDDKGYYTYDISDPNVDLIYYTLKDSTQMDYMEFDIMYVSEDDQACFQKTGICDATIAYKGASFDGIFLIYDTDLDFLLVDLYYTITTEGVYTDTYDAFYQSIQKEGLTIKDVFIYENYRTMIQYNDDSLLDLGISLEYSN